MNPGASFLTRVRARGVSRSQAALLLALAIDNVGSGLVLPLGLVYATRVVGLSVDVAGLSVAVGTALGFLVPPVAARLNHRLGPRPVVVLSQLVQAAGAVMYLFASSASYRRSCMPSARTPGCARWPATGCTSSSCSPRCSSG